MEYRHQRISLGAVSDTNRMIDYTCLSTSQGCRISTQELWFLTCVSGERMIHSGVVLKFINESSEKLLYHDQDALNAILYNKWLSIDVKWNVQTHMFSPNVKIKFIDDISLRYALKKPHIIHYTGRGKPWHYIAVHPLRKNYYKYLEFTPWRGFRSKSNVPKHA